MIEAAPLPPYELVGRLGRRCARLRFPGKFEGRAVTWHALVLAVDPGDGAPQYIDVGAARPDGWEVTIGVKVTRLDRPTLAKAVIMVRNYKRLRRGRHEFAVPPPGRLRLRRVISGGQTGVDRAALDTALALGLACGGWCPRGRRAEDGAVPLTYPLRETRTADYRERTRRNVLAADATLVLTRGRPTRGTAYTLSAARRAGKPVLVVDLGHAPSTDAVRGWLAAQRVEVLNVAGPRESLQPGIHAEARALLQRALAND